MTLRSQVGKIAITNNKYFMPRTLGHISYFQQRYTESNLSPDILIKKKKNNELSQSG